LKVKFPVFDKATITERSSRDVCNRGMLNRRGDPHHGLYLLLFTNRLMVENLLDLQWGMSGAGRSGRVTAGIIYFRDCTFTYKFSASGRAIRCSG
jgi:hypothetical protein